VAWSIQYHRDTTLLTPVVAYEGKKKNRIGQSFCLTIDLPFQLTQIFSVCASKGLVYKTLVWSRSPNCTVVSWFIYQRFHSIVRLYCSIMRHATLSPLAMCLAGAGAAASLPKSQSCDVSLANIGLSQDSTIFFPNSSGWESQNIRWTEYMAPTYSLSVRPTHVSDVQALVIPAFDYP
jgi:hypothetical protein